MEHGVPTRGPGWTWNSEFGNSKPMFVASDFLSLLMRTGCGKQFCGTNI
jgi:hypothetical protein